MRIAAVLAALLVMVGGVLYLVLSPKSRAAPKRPTVIAADYWNAAPFSQDAWRTLEQPRRRTMFYDLLTNHMRMGMSASEVEAQLGKPESTGREAGDVMWDYDIGDELAPKRTLTLAFQAETLLLTYVDTRGDDARSLATNVRDGADARIHPGQTFQDAVRVFGWPFQWQLTSEGLAAEYNVGAASDHDDWTFRIVTKGGIVTSVSYWNPNRF